LLVSSRSFSFAVFLTHSARIDKEILERCFCLFVTRPGCLPFRQIETGGMTSAINLVLVFQLQFATVVFSMPKTRKYVLAMA